ncbi:MAG TPA: hypothetical protein DEG86_14505 [Halieaceae bacterium]|nr:hypothetical protein [Halieaceae bacterium]HBX74188.1 hypothetical protein [Halieaceae bacterium]|tara:strand:- start:1980 stop:2315 length:336 start_codon:yes stop_codon:yes gene_type:complete
MTSTAPPSLTERQQFWLEHLQACRAEGKATIEYAREHGLSPSGMCSARQDLVHKGVLSPPGKSRFVRARAATPEPGTRWQVQLPNGAAVSFRGAVQPDTLMTVLKAAAAVT